MILSAIEQFAHQLIKAPRVLIAYSGGVDSHVLLHAMSVLREKYQLNLHAVHIHHGLLPHANEWSAHCEKICAGLSVSFQCVKVAITHSKGESLEALARQARYQAFSELMRSEDLLVVAHHQDDQAETLMLQLMRGAGLKGLASMPTKKSFFRGFVLRPFLTVRRQNILSYAKKHNLSWVEDTSNHDLRFDRNYMRFKIMPLMRDRWPGLSKTFLRVARLSAEANELLETMGQDDVKKLQDNNGRLSLVLLKTMAHPRVKNILRSWILHNEFQLPHEKHIDQIIKNVIFAKGDAKPCVSWANVEVRRFRNHLFIMSSAQQIDPSVQLAWDLKAHLSLPGSLGVLLCQTQLGEGINPDLLSERVEVRFRRGGEKIELFNRAGSHSLKKLFQEWGVPSWERDYIPLVFHQKELIVVVGYAVAEKYQVGKEKQGFVIILKSMVGSQ